MIILILISLLWVVSGVCGFELGNYICIFLTIIFAFGVFVSGFVKGGGKYLNIIIFCFLGILGMWFSIYSVNKEADLFAKKFSEDFYCKLTDLQIKSNFDFYKTPEMAIFNISKYGATRKITYQKNGLLRYGLFSQDSKSMWMPECESKLIIITDILTPIH